MVESYGIRIHTYCLMTNLLVETPESNLSRAIQWLNVSYASYFNFKRDREIEKLNVEISRNREEIENIQSERNKAIEAKSRAEQDAAVSGAKLDAANVRLEDWKVIVQGLKTQLSEIKVQDGKVANTELTEYFQCDKEVEDQADREKNAQRYIRSRIRKGHSYSTAEKR